MSRAKYKIISVPFGHPNARYDGTMLEHRWIMIQHLGRPLKENEVVHHRNHNTYDNRIENLQLMTIEEHNIKHGAKPKKVKQNKIREYMRKLGRPGVQWY